MARILVTPRLALRELSDEDARDLVALNAHPDVARFTGDGPLSNVAAALSVLRTFIYPQYREHGVGRWAMDRREDGVSIGWCGLKWLAAEGALDLGYRLLPEHWNRGCATEAAAACVEWARRHRPRTPIVARVDLANAASLRVLAKLAFTLREQVREDGNDTGVFAASSA